MISPKTPAGTRIVCVNDTGSFNPPHLAGNNDLEGLTKGRVYTVKRIEFVQWAGQPAVVLREIVRRRGFGLHSDGYALARFELAALPKAITDCLEVVDLPLIIDEFKREDADAAMRRLLPYA